jgi:hypothetical protein
MLQFPDIKFVFHLTVFEKSWETCFKASYWWMANNQMEKQFKVAFTFIPLFHNSKWWSNISSRRPHTRGMIGNWT